VPRSAASAVALLAVLAIGSIAVGQFLLPPLPKPYEYGNVVINRTSEAHGVAPVTFSHWTHRMQYACRVCHFELGFEFKANATEITEEDCRNGRFCGACHDGSTAFGHDQGNCQRCHASKPPDRKKAFKQTRDLPRSEFGNEIDWTEAVDKGLIAPRYSIFNPEEQPYEFDKLLRLEAEWSMISPAEFPHRAHVAWLDCADCHPDVFNVKKKTTKHFEMRFILEGKFCGVCHLSVAFPIDHCKGCHPQMKNK